MFGKIVRIVVLVPLALIIGAFAVANRHSVTILFDPFSSANPAFQATLPLFVVIFIAVILGVLAGGVVEWMRQGRWRRLTRRLEAENRALHSELYELKRQYVTHEGDPLPPPAARMRTDKLPLALRAPVQ